MLATRVSEGRVGDHGRIADVATATPKVLRHLARQLFQPVGMPLTVRGIPAEHGPGHDLTLIVDRQPHHNLPEVGAMILTMAIRDLDRGRRPRRVGIVAKQGKRRRVGMQETRAGLLHRLHPSPVVANKAWP